MSDERPVVSPDEQKARGYTSGEESHGDQRSGPLASVGKSDGDQNADGLDHKAG